MRLLVIDDDELSRELLAMLLGSEGHEVEVAATGEEALTRLGASERPAPEVVVADMRMPGLSGAALAMALRAAAGPGTKLLAMSGSQPASSALSGFDGFLLKPFAMEDFDAALAALQKRIDIAVAGEAARQSDANEAPALNVEIYAKMAQMMPGAQLDEMYAMCLADARKRLAQMVQLAEAGDDRGFREAAHTVKGGCGMIGATQLYRLAESAEQDGLAAGSESGSGSGSHDALGTSGVTTLLERFSHACDRLERILMERR